MITVRKKVLGSLLGALGLAASMACSPLWANTELTQDERPATRGDRAPDFSLSAENGKTVKLSDFEGKKVVVFFYGSDVTPATATEAREIQKYYKKFKLADVDVLGIGPDPVASHKALATGLDLQFHLLTDKDDSTRKLFKLSVRKGRYGVVIDQKGVIKKIIGGRNYPTTDYISDTYDWIMSTQGSGF